MVKMIKLASRLIFLFSSNLIALGAAVYFVKGFEIAVNFKSFIMTAAIFTLISVFIRPILKAVLSPIIILTLGIGIIFVNALTLYLLDILSADITINGLLPLFYATLIISAINIVIHFSAKRLYKDNKMWGEKIMYISIIQIAISIILIVLILLQERSSGLSGILGGGETQLYQRRRGLEKIIFIATVVLAVVFAGL